MYPIPQPPHTAGTAYTGLRPRIEAHQIPCPVEVQEEDRRKWEHQPFMTLPGHHTPLSTTDYYALDQGNSSPKFIRASTWAFPYTSRLASDCKIPLAAVFQPFAELDPREDPVPLVESVPARCERCRAYVNPWCQWLAGGGKWRCNLCEHDTDVLPEYFCGLDGGGHRLDLMQRPELLKGTVDFKVSDEYWASNPPAHLTRSYFSIEPPPTGAREPKPMYYIFAFDVSHGAVASGTLSAACGELMDILYGNDACFPPESQLAIFTYDRAIHFYDLMSDQDAMMVVSDLEEVFVPFHHGLFVSPIDRADAITTLLRSLPTRFADTYVPESALGSAIRVCQASLAGRGGQVVIFQNVIPQIGDGSLAGRPAEVDMYETDKEKNLYRPRDPAWTRMGEECAEEGIGVSMFLTMDKFIDVGSIGIVPSLTGGQIYYLPRFDAVRDRIVFRSHLQRLMRRMVGYNCTARVRTSKGIRVSEYYGNFHQISPTDMEFAVLDSDKTFTVTLEHSGSLSTRESAYLQSAVLYTTVSGERRVRVCNLALQVVELAANVFNYADAETVVCHIMRKALAHTKITKMHEIREDLTENVSAILLGYRNKCAASTAVSQACSRPISLILPDSFRTMPVLTLGILKSKPIKVGNVNSDVRNYYSHRLMSTSVRQVIEYLYPPLIALHDLDATAAVPDPVTANLTIPSPMKNTYQQMNAGGVYLIDNGECMIIWVGSSVSPQLLLDLFGVDDIHQLNTDITELPVLETLLSTQVRNIIMYRQMKRGYTPKLFIARQNLDGIELEFSDMLVEDQNNGTMPYIDFLIVVHKQIMHALNQGDMYEPRSMRSAW
ncbi:hypothetical protein CPB85DRAFT_1430304 [Mucidula mucida]|nr:hypothetical protein CPB85DRAFT_1430304 [Mucidula mucida]